MVFEVKVPPAGVWRLMIAHPADNRHTTVSRKVKGTFWALHSYFKLDGPQEELQVDVGSLPPC